MQARTQANDREPRPLKITAEAFFRMAATGIFDADSRLELLDGEILEMSPPGPWHALHNEVLADLLKPLMRDAAWVGSNRPLAIGPNTVVMPDIVLLPAAFGSNYDQQPGAADALLVIELSDTTTSHDQGRKLVAYAANGVPEYWIVGRPRDVLRVYREPAARGYALRSRLGRGDTVSCLAVPDRSIPVAALLGPVRPRRGAKPGR